MKFGRIWFVGLGLFLVVLPFTNEPQIRWTRGTSPYHVMRRWERIVTFAIGVGSICLGVFAPFD